MKTVLHTSDSRGAANLGWLQSRHTFSFSSYYNPARERFGLLRVLNDDIVAPGMGFGAHGHDNMEIVSIPLKGTLSHQDSTGRAEDIRTGDVQIMSAGSGIRHSEMNRNQAEPVHFLQIWVFPKLRDIAPRYDQKTFDAAQRLNHWQIVVSPTGEQNAITINQDAWFNLAKLQAGKSVDYSPRKQGNGLYLLVLEGAVTVGSQTLNRRDGYGMWEVSQPVTVTATADADLLLIDVPMD
jgi:redox-sensitive bicupin YhaK (pirin superfamily)